MKKRRTSSASPKKQKRQRTKNPALERFLRQNTWLLLVAVLVLSKVGAIGGSAAAVTLNQGLALFGGCMPIAITGLFSAIAQGKTAAAGVGIVAKKPEQSSKALIMAAMVETYAILALLVSILIVSGVQIG